MTEYEECPECGGELIETTMIGKGNAATYDNAWLSCKSCEWDNRDVGISQYPIWFQV